MTNNELYHHGVRGQKWGVRRYQNKDGSLTYAGKKQALSMQNKYDKFTNNKKYYNQDGSLTYAGQKKNLKMNEKYSNLTGKQLRKSNLKITTKNVSSNSESISSMSNAELRAKVERLQLEQTLRSLDPNAKTKGQKFVDGLKNSTLRIVEDKIPRLAIDYADKKIREQMGLKNSKK